MVDIIQKINPRTGFFDTTVDPASIAIPDGIPSPRDASGGSLPPVTPGTADRWVIENGGTLPGIGPVEAGGYLLYDGTSFTYIQNPANNYVNAGVNNVAVGGLGANQGPFNTTVQTMLDRILYPFIQQTNNLVVAGTNIFEKGVEQAPRLLTNTTTRSLNPTYAITTTIFKRDGINIYTDSGDNSPVTFNETTSITDTTIFSAEVTNSNGYTSTSTKTITALYPYFRGKVNGGSRPTRDQALINSGTKVVADSTGTITIDYESTATDWIWFAIPATSTSKTVWYQNALNNGTIGNPTDLFDAFQIVTIDSPNGYWNGIPYKIYVSTYQTAVTGDPMQLRNS